MAFNFNQGKTIIKPDKTNFIDKVGEFGSQGGRSIFQTLQGASQLGEKALQLPLKAFGAKFDGTSAEKVIPKDLTRKGVTPSEKAGQVFGETAQLFTPVGAEKATLKGVTILEKLLTKPGIFRGLLKQGVRGGIGATEFGSKIALQTGGDPEETKQAATIGGIVPPALRAGGAVAKKVLPAISESIFGALGLAIGKDAEIIKQTFKNPVAVAKAMTENKIPADIRTQAVEVLGGLRKEVGENFNKEIIRMSKLSPRRGLARTQAAPGTPGVFSGVKNQFKNKLEKGTENLKNIMNTFRVSISDDVLNFDKLNSSIVNSSEQKQIQAVWNTLKNQKDFSVKGVQDVAARVNALAKFEKGAKTESSAIIGKIHNTYSNAIKNIYPALGKLRSDFSVDKQLMEGIDDILKSIKNEKANPTAVTGVVRKLSNVFKENNEVYIRALQRLEKRTGVDLLNQLAASEFRNVFPATLGSRLAIAGASASALLNPISLLVLPLFSPRVVGKLATGAGKVAKFGAKIPAKSAIKKGLAPLIIEGNK